jgi:ribonucleotide monophosphatase NagD (HAD superfamily)
MVCANPDLVVMHQGRRMFCAGALAQRYEALGGRVRWHGKPFLSVYTTCFTLLRTDIAGANNAGIDSLFVTSGIHADELGLKPGERPESLQLAAAIAASAAQPTAAMAQVAW